MYSENFTLLSVYAGLRIKWTFEESNSDQPDSGTGAEEKRPDRQGRAAPPRAVTKVIDVQRTNFVEKETKKEDN